MPFIGIIGKESDCNFIKNELQKNSIEKFECININKRSVQNLKNIKFDTIIINDNIYEFLNLSKYLEVIIINSNHLIINTDIIKSLDIIKQYNSNIITYGLNQKANITISSIKSENVLICIQTNIRNIYGKIIEPQEISFQIFKNNRKKVSNTLAIFTILLIYGKFLKKI